MIKGTWNIKPNTQQQNKNKDTIHVAHHFPVNDRTPITDTIQLLCQHKAMQFTNIVDLSE